MTRDEILNMPAGREMDALVASKILGCIVCVNKYKIAFCGCENRNHSIYNEEFPSLDKYSTDISAVWEVVEKYTDAVIEKVGNHYCVNLVVESVCAETAPLAICRAALLAVMK